MIDSLAEIFETAMVIAFGLSWPNNIIKSLKTKSTKGKSLAFMMLIDFGYICGIASKMLNWGNFKWYVFFFYILNFAMVTTDIILYFRYRSREKTKIGNNTK